MAGGACLECTMPMRAVADTIARTIIARLSGAFAHAWACRSVHHTLRAGAPRPQGARIPPGLIKLGGLVERIFFTSWHSLLRTLIIGVLAYVTLVVILRISGNRTLSKMNAFDLVVTVALGSTLASVLLNKSIALAEGALAFALLVALQFIVTWLSVRAIWVRSLVTGEPRMLLYRGEFLPKALRRARVTENEVRAAVRSAGLAFLDDAEAVVMETDGSFSVVRRGTSGDRPSLRGVRGPNSHNDADSDTSNTGQNSPPPPAHVEGKKKVT